MISARQVYEQLQIDPATLRKWVQRGKVRRYGRNAYDIDDIAREFKRYAMTVWPELDAPSDRCHIQPGGVCPDPPAASGSTPASR